MVGWPMTLEDARALDAADPLSAFRDRFVVADPELIYLDGNSLGRLPRVTGERQAAVTDYGWGDRLVCGWGAAGVGRGRGGSISAGDVRRAGIGGDAGA